MGDDRRKKTALSDEDRVSVAEEVIERSGNAGRTFEIQVAKRREAEAMGMDAIELQREYSREAEAYVAQALGRPGITVEPSHWDLRGGGGQALTDGANFIGLAGTTTNEMTLLHEVAHIITRTREGFGGHGPDFQETVHQLYSQYLGPGAGEAFANLVWPEERSSMKTANSDVVARGFLFDEVSFELGQKYIAGTLTATDIIREIEKTWGSVGIWWGSIGVSDDDFYGSASEARDYAGWTGDASIEHRWQDMLDLSDGEVNPSEWMDAEIRVVLVAKKPMRDYGVWNPTTENGEGSMWESTSFFSQGERLELVEVHYAADLNGNAWQIESVGGLTVTANSERFMMPTSEVEQYQKFDIMDFESPEEEAQLWKLAESIRQYGIEKPLTIGVSHDGQYALIVDGHHRLGAAKLLGLSEVPVTSYLWDEVDYNYLLSMGASPVTGTLRQQLGYRTAAAGEFKVMLKGPGGVDLGLEPDVDAPTVFFFDRLLDTIRFVKEQQGRDLWYFSFDDDRGFVSTRFETVKVYEQGQDKSDEFQQFLGSRTAAEPGGVLPWTPSDNGYYWISLSDGTLEAVTNDGINRMYLTDEGYGWVWEVHDDIGKVESGNFGTSPAMKRGDALRDRANDLLAEFDTSTERRTRGPSRGYQDDYSQAPNTLWSKRKTTSQKYAERLRRRGRG